MLTITITFWSLKEATNMNDSNNFPQYFLNPAEFYCLSIFVLIFIKDMFKKIIFESAQVLEGTEEAILY